MYTPYVQFMIAIPNTQQIQKPQFYEVKVELGMKSDENIIEVVEGHKLDTPCTVLALNDLEKHDLSRYTNIKITISEGKYKSKVFAYIPIETIKNLVSCP